MSDERDLADLRTEVETAFGSIAAGFDVLTGTVYIARAIVDVLAARGLLSVSDVRDRALSVLEAGGATDGGPAQAIRQILIDPAPADAGRTLN